MKHQDSSAFTWLSRGEVVLSAAAPGTLRSVEACFDNANQRDPTHWRAKFRAGLIYAQWSYLDRALERLSQAVEIHPGNPFLWKLMGDCHNRLGHALVARECYEFALVRRPGYLPAIEALRSMTLWGRIRAQVGRWWKASGKGKS